MKKNKPFKITVIDDDTIIYKDKTWYSPSKAQIVYNISRGYVYKLVDKEILQYVIILGKTFFRRKDNENGTRFKVKF